MGVTTHLEKMGRELNCPICLSLFDSAVSLTCNHVFCNACIAKSMKVDSTCPVCKVPYHRREVRAAPHMDNLVTIYKSMEVASGVNIFVSQNGPLNKPSGEENHVEAGCKSSKEMIDGAFQVSENQQISKRKGSRRTKRTNEDAPAPIILKPSSQTKKRVQVLQCPPQETPAKASKSDEMVGNSKDECRKSSPDLEEITAPKKEGRPVLSPFFWLRDEENEGNLSQIAERDALLDITPPAIPSFSDLKDSDSEGESPSKEELHCKSNAMDLFDSEMFEWTQRPCSPEILPSPVKAQVPDINDSGQIKERNFKAASGGETNEEHKAESEQCVSAGQETSTSDKASNASSAKVKDRNGRATRCKPNKKGRNANENVKQKHYMRKKGQGSGMEADLKKLQDRISRHASDEKGGSVSFGKKRSRSKAAHTSIPTAETTANTKPKKRRAANDPSLKKKKENYNSKPWCNEDCSLKSNKLWLDSAADGMLEELSKGENQTNNDMNDQGQPPLSSVVEDSETSEFKEDTTNQATDVKSGMTLERTRRRRCKKRLRVSVERAMPPHNNQVGCTNVSLKGLESIEIVEDSKIAKGLECLSTVENPYLTNAAALRKCEALTNEIQCAFCHSAENSEASGEMAHYYNGRPVSVNYNGGSMVIHSHTNCTEWAPNVYFKDDTAINLEAELARSRRIKCCCCGLKGAVLGCYEKSCRKSFHVPCAKLIPECRWDTENFVMLCPLHASFKLPCEEAEPKDRSQKQLHTEPNQVGVKLGFDVLQNRNFCGSFAKVVLCCSGLTVQEMEVVSEFAKLPGVTILKKWESNVTHIIASTNENGACKRTLKVLMGILEGKWILNIEWVRACMKAMKRVDEEQYEITIDVHGIRDGPRLGRRRLLEKQPKLFDGFKFYLMGDFEPSYKGYLQDLVIAAGGTILHRRPILEQKSHLSSSFIVYGLEFPDNCDLNKNNTTLSRRQSDAATLASTVGARAVSNSWVLNSIAACKLQRLSEQ